MGCYIHIESNDDNTTTVSTNYGLGDEVLTYVVPMSFDNMMQLITHDHWPP